MKLFRRFFEVLIELKLDFYSDERMVYFKDEDKGQINALLSEYAERYYI